MNLNIGNYTIRKEDKWNVTLSVTRPKQPSPLHPEVTGDKVEVVGYYADLKSALKSLLNRTLLDDFDIRDAKELLEAIQLAEERIIKEVSDETP